MKKNNLETHHLDIQRANEAFNNGRHQDAWALLHKTCTELAAKKYSAGTQSLFISSCLELSELGFILGKNIYEITPLLVKANEEAALSGDRRSQALINLHLGRFYYLTQRRTDALEAFEKGQKEVKELGDEDIAIRSAELIGMNYFTQGRIKEAYPYFEKGTEYFETGNPNMLPNAMAPLFLAYCAAYMGNFHHSTGTLDYYHRFFMDKGNRPAAAILRAALGIILLMVKKGADGYKHLKGARQEAEQCDNTLALYMAKGGLAYYEFLEGDIKKSYDMMLGLFKETQNIGIGRQYSSPVALETFYEFYRQGFDPNLESIYKNELERILKEPNIFLKGVALRLRAHDILIKGGNPETARQDLEMSLEYLSRSGGAVQLAKTRFELARMELKKGETENARSYVHVACKELGGYRKIFYPDDLQFLLRIKTELPDDSLTDEELLRQFMDSIQERHLSVDLPRIFQQVVKSTNRLLGAERAGIFFFEKNTKKAPVLKAGHHITSTDIQSEDFRSNMSLVFEAYRTRLLQIVQKDKKDTGNWPYQSKSILCLPIFLEDDNVGVLYFDNAYTEGSFNFFDMTYLNKLSEKISRYIGTVYSQPPKTKKAKNQRIYHSGASESPDIITQNSIMLHMLNQVDRVAATRSTILILGETGVGKELLARRIHNKSQQSNQAFVVVDPTTIPEHLVESELFGHEKGAFTGADSQKKGLLEIAHHGTLFIDEIGDIPLPVQVKLLRVIQERTFMRVGSTKTIISDFRLVAATNRNLEQMVKEGTFREDLYYRINVVPVELPALRDRIDDVPLLSRHFLKRHSNRHHHPELKITPADDKCLMSYNWPGNIRELQNVIERAVLLSQDGELDFNLSPSIKTARAHPFEDLPTMNEIQRRYIRYVLEKTHGKKSGPGSACEILNMKQSTLFNRMKKLKM